VKRIITLSTAVILAALAFAGCGKTVINGDTPVTPDYTSPAKVLKTVQLSFNETEINCLKRALSPTFVFYSDPEEIGRAKPDGNSRRPPPCYNYTEFWNIAYDMFNRAYDISLSIHAGGVGEPAPEENTYNAGNVELSLLVMADEKSGYLADGYCHFEFEKYKDEQGRELWRITKWWDKTEGGGAAPAGVERVPLWYILSLYEKPT
jgi:hypothetical protein